MRYTSREYLTIIELTEERATLSFDELASVLMEKPANIVYVELAGILYGIVTTGDILRALDTGKACVEISRKFMSISLFPQGREQARRTFLESKGKGADERHINNLPVVDENEVLLGEYTKWDELYTVEYLISAYNDSYISKCAKQLKRLVLVKPSSPLQSKQRLFSKWELMLETNGVAVEAIERTQVPEYINGLSPLCFIDHEEMVGISNVCKLLGLGVEAQVLFTPERLLCTLNERITLISILNRLQEKDIFCVTMGYGGDWTKGTAADVWTSTVKYNRMIKEHYMQLGETRNSYLLQQMKKEFFGEIYNEEYEKQIMPLPIAVSLERGNLVLQDQNELFVHIQNNERLTVNQPRDYERCVYMYGRCDIFGIYVEDRHTIASFLQGKVNLAGQKCKVVNNGAVGYSVVGCNASYFAQALQQRIEATPMKRGDIVIISAFMLGECCSAPYINIADIYEDHNIPISWVVDMVGHHNYKVNKLTADVIYDEIFSELQDPVEDRSPIELRENFVIQNYIDRYFAHFDPSAYKNIGAIVMNCNPFTYGHRHLIETALKQVDFLIIFVVQEDRSLFSFGERFAMVHDGVADLDRVMVVPGGEFIISQATFPQYFVKVIDANLVENVNNDITIFAEEIASKLHISHRFVGEERVDPVTNEYNNAMKRILPSYGIEVVEIARLTTGEQVISASRVRKCLEEEDIAQLDTLVPESTKHILFGKQDENILNW